MKSLITTVSTVSSVVDGAILSRMMPFAIYLERSCNAGSDGSNMLLTVPLAKTSVESSTGAADALAPDAG